MTTGHRLLLNLSAMARRLRVQPQWLRAEANAGRIPAIPAGDTYLFAPDDVERLLYERAHAAAQAPNKPSTCDGPDAENHRFSTPEARR